MARTMTLLVFGASGDLTERLLLPGIGSLIASGRDEDAALVDGLTILGTGRSEHDSDDWRSTIADAFSGVGADGGTAEAIVARSEYVRADPSDADDVRALLERAEGRIVLYFALPPFVVGKVLDALAEVDRPDDLIYAMEKPFGEDGDDAADLNAKLAALASEDQVHRIDHFLGQSAVIDLLGLRFANRTPAAVWSAEHVERVEIVYDEELGLEGRAAYYDTAGALVDMLQSHLLQVLSVVAMEAPASTDEADFRAATGEALLATRLWSGDPVFGERDEPFRRGRYTAGRVGDRDLPAYVDEEGVEETRGTETLAEMVVEVGTSRWAGVPFVLRSGKAIEDPRRSVTLTLREAPTVPAGVAEPAGRERIVLTLKPPSLELRLTSTGGDEPFDVQGQSLRSDLPESPVTEYGEVFRGVLGGDPTLAVRGDVAEHCWRIVAPVLEAWRADEQPLDDYAAGSAGPESWTLRD